MARKDKNYVFKDSNEDQRKVKVSKRVNWMKKKAIEEQKQAQSNQEQIVKNDFAEVFIIQSFIMERHIGDTSVVFAAGRSKLLG